MRVPYETLYDKVIDDNCKLPLLKGVLFFGELAVASDNYTLVAVKSDFPETFKGRVISKQGDYLYGVYPATLDTFKFDPKELNLCAYAAQLKEACEAVPNWDDSEGLRMGIEVDKLVFNPARILKVLPIFEEASEKPEAFTRCAKGVILSPTLILRSPNVTALIAATNIPPGTKQSLTIPEALEIGELL